MLCCIYFKMASFWHTNCIPCACICIAMHMAASLNLTSQTDAWWQLLYSKLYLKFIFWELRMLKRFTGLMGGYRDSREDWENWKTNSNINRIDLKTDIKLKFTVVHFTSKKWRTIPLISCFKLTLTLTGIFVILLHYVCVYICFLYVPCLCVFSPEEPLSIYALLVNTRKSWTTLRSRG